VRYDKENAIRRKKSLKSIERHIFIQQEPSLIASKLKQRHGKSPLTIKKINATEVQRYARSVDGG
jgi:hypothetical protein